MSLWLTTPSVGDLLRPLLLLGPCSLSSMRGSERPPYPLEPPGRSHSVHGAAVFLLVSGVYNPPDLGLGLVYQRGSKQENKNR